jgi:MoaA/NifB/PqqE/SkfB family radical SAM enzyme
MYYITYRCNARCSFCSIWRDPALRQVPDCRYEDVIRNLKALKKTGVKFIDFTGGEPLLHPELPEFLDAAKQLGLYTTVTTNCRKYPDIAGSIRGKVNLLHFSLDSMSVKEHDDLRGGSFHDSVMHSIDIALHLGERPDLLFTVTNENARAIGGLSAFAKEKKLMLIVNPVFGYGGEERIDAETLDYLEKYGRKPYVYMNAALHKLIRNDGNRRTHPRCRAVSSTIVISPDNQVLLPCFHQSNKEIPISSELTDIMKSLAYQSAKEKQGRYPFCEGCTINCYFDPSFLYKADGYLLSSLVSKAKYGFDKYVRR